MGTASQGGEIKEPKSGPFDMETGETACNFNVDIAIRASLFNVYNYGTAS